MHNYVSIMGRFVGNPECSATQSGITVARFTLACDRDFKSKETQERETDFIDCVAWRHTAEFIKGNFSKGRMALVDGRLQVNTWIDKDGKKHWRYEVKVENIYFADSKRPVAADAAPSNASESAPSPETQEAEHPPEDLGSIADNLPF